MTRINSAIPPDLLCDQMLVAEYRELPRVSTLAWKRAELAGRGVPFPPPPARFTLGPGHVVFFMDKGKFLAARFNALVVEMTRRGFRPVHTEYRRHPDGCNNDHVPDERERELLEERIKQRLSTMKKPPRWTIPNN